MRVAQTYLSHLRLPNMMCATETASRLICIPLRSVWISQAWSAICLDKLAQQARCLCRQNVNAFDVPAQKVLPPPPPSPP